MKKTYLNEQHRRYSEACQEEVREMMKHPLTAEEKEEQMSRMALHFKKKELMRTKPLLKL